MTRFSKLNNQLMKKGRFLAGRSSTEIIIHCSANKGKFTVKDAYKFHTDPKPMGRGWNDIGYHFYIERDGTIFEGRPISQIGAHVAGQNVGTIGVCYEGGLAPNGTPADTRTPAQRKSMVKLVEALCRDNWDITRISGHNEYSNKACPSFDVEGDTVGNITGFYKGRRIRSGESVEADKDVHEKGSGLQHFLSMVVRFLRSLFGSR